MKHQPPCKGCDRVLCARSRNDCPAWVEYKAEHEKVKESRIFENSFKDMKWSTINNTWGKYKGKREWDSRYRK